MNDRRIQWIRVLVSLVVRKRLGRLFANCEPNLLDFGLVKKLSISTATWAKVAIDLPKHDGESSCGKNKDGAKQGHTVAILASSSLVFLILWFGLIRAGFKVLSIE